MTDTDKSAEVTQADRDAAADWVEAVHGDGFRQGHHHLYRGGKADASQLVQAFARHRIEATADLLEALEHLTALSRGIVAQAYIDDADDAIARARGTS